MTRFIPGCRWLAVALLSLLAAPAWASESPPTAANTHRLPEWVGDDVGICLQFDNLPQQLASFQEGSLCKRLLNFPPIALWHEQHRPQFALVRGEIERRTGANIHDLMTRLPGREVLFAIWPPVDPAVDKPSALLLAESADLAVMQHALASLVAARRQAGRWQGQQSLSIAGESFTIDAVAADDDQAVFFITSADNVAMIATSEPVLRAALERRAKPKRKATSLASSPVYAAAGQRLAVGAAARLFVNPRAWDLALQADLKRKKPDSEEARSQAMVVAAWRATDYVAGAVHLTPQLGVELAWKWRADDLPEPLREVAASFLGPAEFVNDLPADVLIALAGHVDVGRLVRHAIAENWQKAAAEPARSSSGPDSQNVSILAWALAPGLGPDWGCFLAPTRRRSATAGAPRLPVDLVFGIQTRPLEPDTERPALAQNVEPLFHALLSAAVEAVNRQKGMEYASIKSVENSRPGNDDRRITVVSGVVPHHPEQEVAYCVDEHDRIWLGTSAASLEQAASAGGGSLLDDAAVQAQLGARGGLSGLVYVNLAGWRDIASKTDAVGDFLWHEKHLDARAKQQRYQELLALLQLADRLLLTSQVDESTAHLSLNISADEH